MMAMMMDMVVAMTITRLFHCHCKRCDDYGCYVDVNACRNITIMVVALIVIMGILKYALLLLLCVCKVVNRS